MPPAMVVVMAVAVAVAGTTPANPFGRETASSVADEQAGATVDAGTTVDDGTTTEEQGETTGITILSLPLN